MGVRAHPIRTLCVYTPGMLSLLSGLGLELCNLVAPMFIGKTMLDVPTSR